ncbi:hypothetical protein C8J56DRAFT_965091 [Mycena floridula]|nr:hypothetical protein C8J56DRAFT_965091 [Mycena floridula]
MSSCPVCGSAYFSPANAVSADFTSQNQHDLSRYRDLLRSNHPASDSELAQIKRDTEMLEQRLRHLKLQEEKICNILVELGDQKKATLDALNLRHAITAPVRRLPNEIMEKILLVGHAAAPASPFEMTEIPWSASHLSGRWRDVSISSPRLWSNISIEIKAWDTASDPEHLLEAWLTRSMDSPLIVQWLSPTEQWDDKISSSNTTSALTMLISECHRWERVSFSGVIPDASITFKKVRGRISKLIHLEWMIYNDLEQIFVIAPVLEGGKVMLRHLDRHSLPWDQLRRLELVDPSRPRTQHHAAQNPLPPLQACSQLEELTISSVRIFGPTPVVTLPRLRKLAGPDSLLCHLKTPALEMLSVGYLSTVETIVSRSFCQLDQLSLTGVHREDNTFGSTRHALELCSNLRYLHVLSPTAHPVCAHVLLLPGNGSAVLPRLETLKMELSLDIPDITNPDRWFAMVESRCGSAHSIKTLELVITGIMDESEASNRVSASLHSSISRLRAKGVDVVEEGNVEQYNLRV